MIESVFVNKFDDLNYIEVPNVGIIRKTLFISLRGAILKFLLLVCLLKITLGN